MIAASSERAVRCLRLIIDRRGKNQCASEQLPGSSLCSHHLAEAAAEYRAIVAEATAIHDTIMGQR